MSHKPILRLLAILLVALPMLAAPAHPARAAVRNPILFVHGWNGSSSTWTTMVSRFKQSGWTDSQLYNWSYDSSLSNATIAAQIKTKVNQIRAATGAAKVDLITHSMGALSSRYYLKNLGGAAYVDAWVSLGGPNHGTLTANICPLTSCVEMRAGSSFLNNLNSVDETPGAARYATWRSSCDLVIIPTDSVPVSGASNHLTSGCLSHSALHDDATVFNQVRTWIDQ